MVTAAGSTVKYRPSAIFLKDRTKVEPRIRVREHELRIDDAEGTGADDTLIVIRPRNLPSRTVLEPNEHFLVISAFSDLRRECPINTFLLLQTIDSGPNRLARLVGGRKHVY